MAGKTNKTIEQVTIEIEEHLADIDSTLLRYAADRTEDLKATQHTFELVKADLDDIRGELTTVSERLKRLEARNR